MNATMLKVVLPDGSICLVEPVAPSESLVSRVVGDRVAWADLVGGPDHAARLSVIIGAMGESPNAFVSFGMAPNLLAPWRNP